MAQGANPPYLERMNLKNRYALSLAKDVIHTGVKRIKNLVGMVYTVSTLISRQPECKRMIRAMLRDCTLLVYIQNQPRSV
jgi:hypothetical protein